MVHKTVSFGVNLNIPAVNSTSEISLELDYDQGTRKIPERMQTRSAPVRYAIGGA